MSNLIFLISEAPRNFRNELYDSVEAQRNSAIAERYFRTKLKCNQTFAIEISQHKENSAFFLSLDWKRASHLLDKAKQLRRLRKLRFALLIALCPPLLVCLIQEFISTPGVLPYQRKTDSWLKWTKDTFLFAQGFTPSLNLIFASFVRMWDRVQIHKKQYFIIVWDNLKLFFSVCVSKRTNIFCKALKNNCSVG